jgi:hypothetical protein
MRLRKDVYKPSENHEAPQQRKNLKSGLPCIQELQELEEFDDDLVKKQLEINNNTLLK